MALTSDQATSIRRHAGYGLLGSAPPSTFSGPRFFTSFGQFEFRINNLAPSEVTIALQFQIQLDALELAIYGVGGNLDTDAASVWTHNKNELADRETLYASFRKKLCDFLMIPLGPYACGHSGSYTIAV